ncbi:GFA family protein [Flavisphingomonas formosensis]|uniref:GFA family protein n=1 Tax=Flavisphingomonas formosensis TaxID=861534 RepID=UPI0012FAC9BA|nr:GFA family protein [Sphingomonas formosensis]
MTAAPTLPAEGGCRCGAIRVRISAPPLLTAACHCTGCQRMTASAFSITVTVPTQGFELLQGEPVIGGLHGEQIHHFHCDYCKSWVFTRVEPDMGFVNVRATMLDDASWFEPFAEFWTSEKLAWANLPVVHSFETQPAIEEFGPLVADYMGR